MTQYLDYRPSASKSAWNYQLNPYLWFGIYFTSFDNHFHCVFGQWKCQQNHSNISVISSTYQETIIYDNNISPSFSGPCSYKMSSLLKCRYAQLWMSVRSRILSTMLQSPDMHLHWGTHTVNHINIKRFTLLLRLSSLIVQVPENKLRCWFLHLVYEPLCLSSKLQTEKI